MLVIWKKISTKFSCPCVTIFFISFMFNPTKHLLSNFTLTLCIPAHHICFCCLAHYRGGQGGQSLLLPVPHSPTSHTFCAPLSHDSHPSLCCSCLQVNQEDQKLRFNFQIVPKLNILVHFLAFVLAGRSLGSDESYYKFH